MILFYLDFDDDDQHQYNVFQKNVIAPQYFIGIKCYTNCKFKIVQRIF